MQCTTEKAHAQDFGLGVPPRLLHMLAAATPPSKHHFRPFQASDPYPQPGCSIAKGEGGSQPQAQTSDFFFTFRWHHKANMPPKQGLPYAASARAKVAATPHPNPLTSGPSKQVFQILKKDVASPRAKAAANPNPKPLTFWRYQKPANDGHHPLQRQGAANFRVTDLHRCRASKPNHWKNNKSTIRVQKNPKPVEVKARVERQRGWACAGRGARLGAFSTSAPTH